MPNIDFVFAINVKKSETFFIHIMQKRQKHNLQALSQSVKNVMLTSDANFLVFSKKKMFGMFLES